MSLHIWLILSDKQIKLRSRTMSRIVRNLLAVLGVCSFKIGDIHIFTRYCLQNLIVFSPLGEKNFTGYRLRPISCKVKRSAQLACSICANKTSIDFLSLPKSLKDLKREKKINNSIDFLTYAWKALTQKKPQNKTFTITNSDVSLSFDVNKNIKGLYQFF